MHNCILSVVLHFHHRGSSCKLYWFIHDHFTTLLPTLWTWAYRTVCKSLELLYLPTTWSMTNGLQKMSIMHGLWSPSPAYKIHTCRPPFRSSHTDLFLLVESVQTHRRKGNVLLYLIQHFATSYDVPQTIAHPPLKHSQYRASWAL